MSGPVLSTAGIKTQRASEVDPTPEVLSDVAGATVSSSRSLPWWGGIAAFLTAYVLRLYEFATPWYWLDDVTINVTNAYNYARYGFLGPDNWWTQPLKHLLLYASILVFGDDLVGWRMRNILFGAGVVLMTYLIGRAMFRRPFPAVAAAVVIALDPLCLAFSRNTSEDIPATFFILLSCWFFTRAMKSNRTIHWTATGISLGLAWALRWYSVIPGVVMLVLAIARRRHEGAPAISSVIAFLGPLPLAVYSTAFLPWISRGYSLVEWLQLNVDAFRVQVSGFQGIDYPTMLRGVSGWFITWIGAAQASYRPGAYSVLVNNPPVWVLFVPGVAYLLWRGHKKRSMPAYLVGGSFVLLYIFFLTSQRPILLYSSIPLLPFGALGLGFTADQLLKKAAWVLLAAGVLWGLYLYPLSSAIPVSQETYAWLFSRLAIR